MKRDMDLIRQILLRTEEMPSWTAESTGLAAEEMPFWREKPTGSNIRRLEEYRDQDGFLNLGKYLGVEGYSTERISYHVKIMAEADLVEVVQQQANTMYGEYSGVSVYVPVGLTWRGHEFLEAIKDDTRWSKVKSTMVKAGGFVFEIAKQAAIMLLEKQVSSLLSAM